MVHSLDIAAYLPTETVLWHRMHNVSYSNGSEISSIYAKNPTLTGDGRLLCI